MLGRLVSAWQAWRERRTLARRPIPDALWHETMARYPFLGDLDEAEALLVRAPSPPVLKFITIIPSAPARPPPAPGAAVVVAARAFSIRVRAESMIAALSSSLRRCQSNGILDDAVSEPSGFTKST